MAREAVILRQLCVCVIYFLFSYVVDIGDSVESDLTKWRVLHGSY